MDSVAFHTRSGQTFGRPSANDDSDLATPRRWENDDVENPASTQVASERQGNEEEVVSSSFLLTRRLMAEGCEIGLKGADLRSFVLGERELEAKLQTQREEREAERRFQLEQLRIQSAMNGNRNNNANDSRKSGDFKPKIPFLEDKDDIESWFRQYEHYIHDCKLDKEKASRIVYFLKGKARVIYSMLSEDDARDCETLKHALYEGFQLTAEEYRKRF